MKYILTPLCESHPMNARVEIKATRANAKLQARIMARALSDILPGNEITVRICDEHQESEDECGIIAFPNGDLVDQNTGKKLKL